MATVAASGRAASGIRLTWKAWPKPACSTLKNTTPITATPIELPSCTVVACRPDTVPACSGATRASTIPVSGAVSMPMPIPVTSSGSSRGRVLLALTAAGHGSVAPLLLPLLVTGIGMGMLTAPLTGIVLARVAPEQAGTVAGLQATTVQLGNSIGVAVIGVVFFNAVGGGLGHAFQISLLPLAALPLAAAAAIQLIPRPGRTGPARPRPARPRPTEVRDSAQP